MSGALAREATRATKREAAASDRFTWVLPWWTFFLTAFAVLAQPWASDWALKRSSLEAHEYHRLITGHFVHYGRAHFLGDVLAFAFWAGAIEQYGRRLLVVSILVSTVVASLAVEAHCPLITEYRGLSAVDCTLAVELFVLLLRDRARAGDARGAALFGVVLAVFGAKTAYEFATGHAVLASDLGPGVALVPVTHAVGIGVGAAMVTLYCAIVRDESRGLRAD